MTIAMLPREQGMWIRCDGTQEMHDPQACPQKIYSGVILAKKNRAWFAKKESWGRGLRKGYKRRDLCPTCLPVERQLFATQKADWEAEKARRAANRKAEAEARKAAKLSGSPPPKKPRKDKANRDASSSSGPTPTASPSADSAQAPAT